jgi:hypothetical protein
MHTVRNLRFICPPDVQSSGWAVSVVPVHAELAAAARVGQEIKVELFEKDVTAAQEIVRELERARGELRIDYWRGRWHDT